MKPGQGKEPSHDIHADYVLGAEAEAASQPSSPEPAAMSPPSTRASRPPRLGSLTTRTTFPGMVVLGMMLLATTA